MVVFDVWLVGAMATFCVLCALYAFDGEAYGRPDVESTLLVLLGSACWFIVWPTLGFMMLIQLYRGRAK